MKIYIVIFTLFITSSIFGQMNCDSLNKLANQVYQEKGPTEAIKIYTKIIEQNCHNLSMTYNNRGFLYNEIQYYRNAVSDFDKAIKLDPKNDIAYANEANSQNMLDNPSGALSFITKAINLSPSNDQYYRLKGDIFYSIDNYDSAIASYQKAIILNPNYLELYTLVSKSYEEKNIKVIRDGNIITNNIDKLSDNTANLYYQNRDSGEAILTTLIQRFPKNKLLIFNRAEFYRRNSMYDKAIPDYLQGFAENGQNGREEYMSNLANCYDGLGEYKTAIEYYTKSIAIKPNVLAYANRGRRYKKMNKLDLAIADEESVIKLDSTYAQAYLIIGNCYLEMNQKTKAHQYFVKGLKQHPEGEIKAILEMQLSLSK